LKEGIRSKAFGEFAGALTMEADEKQSPDNVDG